MIAHFTDLFIFQQLPVVKREPHPIDFRTGAIARLRGQS
jgi:hypothetical protein